MRRISEAVAEKSGQMTKGQRLLAAYVSEHCDRAAFMNSFELAGVTGVSQSSVVRFAAMLGYEGYGDFQQALQAELKYRLDILERYEVIREVGSDGDLMGGIAMTDALNIKKTMGYNSPDSIRTLCTRLMMAARVYVYGQGYAASAALYLAGYLGLLLPNVVCVNLSGMDTAGTLSGIDSGDALVLLSFPFHSEETLRLLELAKGRDAFAATISEDEGSEVGARADLSLASEWGELGINGSMAPVISLCSAIVCMLARQDEQAGRKLRRAGQLRSEERA